MATPQEIAAQWKSFSPERRDGLLARMSPEQKGKLRSMLEQGAQPQRLEDTPFDNPAAQGRRIGNGMTERVRFQTPRNESEQAMQTLLAPVTAPVAALKNAKGPVALRPFEAIGSMMIDPQVAEFEKGRPVTGSVPFIGPMIGGAIDSYRQGEYTASAGNVIGALTAAHGMGLPKPELPALTKEGFKVAAENAVESVPSPRGVLEKRMSQTPTGEQFSRGEVLNSAQEHGVNLDLAQATDSTVANAAKKATRYSLTGQGAYETNLTKNLNALEKWADTEAGQYSKNAATREVFGGQMSQALKQHLEARKSAATQAFRDLDAQVGANKVDVSGSLQEMAKKIVDQNKDYYAEHPELKPTKAWAILEDLARQPVETKAAVSGEFIDASGSPIATGVVRTPITKTMSWMELHQLRSDLMDFYRNNPDVVKGRSEAWIQQMVAEADNALNNSANGLNAGQQVQFRKANQVWESVKNTYDNPQSPYYQAVRTQTPSSIPQMFRNRPEVIRQVRETLGSLDGDFQRQFVDTVLNGKDGATLDLQGLNGRLNRIPNDILVSMLGKKGANNLRMLGKVAAKVTVDANPSGTAKVGVPAAEVTAFFHNPVAGAAELAGTYAGSRAINSPKVVNYLTKKK